MKQETYQDEEPYYKPNDKAYLEDWVFHYSSIRNQWNAVPRETYIEYWSEHDHPNVLRSSSFTTLLELIHKSKGDKKIIESLVNGKHK